MKNFSFDNPYLSEMSAEGRRSILIVEKYVRAFLLDDVKTQLEFLADEFTIDYSGKYGYGQIKLPKAEAVCFHKTLRSQIEIVDFNIFKAFGDGNSVFILGETTERARESDTVFKEKCIWVYTLKADRIFKIEFLKECHPLFNFFSTIIDRCKI